MGEKNPVQELVRETGITEEALGISLLICEPDTSLAEIARRLGIDRARLYRMKGFMAAWRTHCLPDEDRRPPSGSVDEFGNLDAFSERSEKF